MFSLVKTPQAPQLGAMGSLFGAALALCVLRLNINTIVRKIAAIRAPALVVGFMSVTVRLNLVGCCD